MNPVVYFAEPIDADRRVTQEQQLRNSMVATLLRHGMAIYRPANAWQAGPAWSNTADPAVARAVEAVNRNALERANLVVARWPKSVSSVGVPMEIEYATNVLGREVILFTNRTESISLAANPHIKIVSDEAQYEKAIANWMRSTPIFEVTPRKIEMRFSGPFGAMARAHPGDAGFDLIVSEDTKVPYGGTARIPCDTAVELPDGVFGWVVARSSTFDRYNVTILPGIIDTDYRGKLFAVALNESTVDHVWVKAGSRIAQLVLLPNVAAGIRPVRVDEVSTDTARGSNGFGSTGV